MAEEEGGPDGSKKRDVEGSLVGRLILRWVSTGWSFTIRLV